MLNPEKAIERFSHARACIRQAVHHIINQRRIGNLQYAKNPHIKYPNRYIGPTYAEIRMWIQREKNIHIETIARRVLDLVRAGEMRKETDESGRVHVYPI